MVTFHTHICDIKHLDGRLKHGKMVVQAKEILRYMYVSDLHSLCKQATIHQVTTMLATSKNGLFPGHNHLLIIGTDDLTL